MIDAFKPEYIKHAPYLKSLTNNYQWGELEMIPGHGGPMEIFFKGRTNKLALFYKKKKSSLKWIKHFTWLDNYGKTGRFIIDSIINLQRLIQGKELYRTGQIPLKKLHKLDFAVNMPPYNGLNVEYKYFKDLDSIGHKYGTKSQEIIQAIRKVDKEVSKLKFDVILSDHGMIDIKKTIKVPQTKNCFLDSDIARYWGTEQELKKIKQNLPLKEGKIIDWPDKRFGQLIFLANPGNLILPNYWQRKSKVKAMHGYDGKHKDLRAFYIIKKKGKRKDLKIKELHNIVFSKELHK